MQFFGLFSIFAFITSLYTTLKVPKCFCCKNPLFSNFYSSYSSVKYQFLFFIFVSKKLFLINQNQSAPSDIVGSVRTGWNKGKIITEINNYNNPTLITTFESIIQLKNTNRENTKDQCYIDSAEQTTNKIEINIFSFSVSIIVKLIGNVRILIFIVIKIIDRIIPWNYQLSGKFHHLVRHSVHHPVSLMLCRHAHQKNFAIN